MEKIQILRGNTMARTNYSTYLAIKRKILDIFRSEKFENNKLPPESQLSKRLGISLVTLREALLMLALEGYITKRHGSGNYIHPSALGFENRSYYFMECLKRDGFEPSMEVLEQTYIPADEHLAGLLKLSPGDRLLRNRLLYKADGKPAILTVGHIPAAYLIRTDIENMDFLQLHVMLEEFCGKDLAHSLCEILPLGLPDGMESLFELPAGSPITYMEQVFYSIQDDPILCNLHYIYPNRYKIRTLQNWALGN